MKDKEGVYMKALYFIALFSPAVFSHEALSDCSAAHVIKDAINAIAPLSRPELATDIIGWAIKSGRQKAYNIWVNYRDNNFSDKYEAVVEAKDCKLISLRVVVQNQPIKEGSASWDDEILEIKTRTRINSSTLFLDPPTVNFDPYQKYTAYLILPDLDQYVVTPHALASQRQSKNQAEHELELITQLIQEAHNSGGYLDVNYVIERKSIYSKFFNPLDLRIACVKKSTEVVTASFPNGLTYKSTLTRHYGEVSDSFCLPCECP